MKRLFVGAMFGSSLFGLTLAALAQETITAPLPEPTHAGLAADGTDPSLPIPFEDGSFTIAETPDGDKILAFDSEELARNFVVYYDRTIALGDVNVALFAVGDGGNQCGPATLIAWKPQGEGIRTEIVGEECGAPPAAVTADSLYFVPYLIPGATAPVQVWSPEKGLRVSGIMSFAPQPGTGWSDFDQATLESIVDAFDNEAVYRAAVKLLGSDLNDFATGLLTGGSAQETVNGVVYGNGCVPHACGTADAFMAVDPRARRLYFAQTGEQPEPRTWPPLRTWPADMRSAMKAALAPQ